MPFKSKSQLGYMFANHPDIAKRWAHETPDIKGLPDKASKNKSTLAHKLLHRKTGKK